FRSLRNGKLRKATEMRNVAALSEVERLDECNVGKQPQSEGKTYRRVFQFQMPKQRGPHTGLLVLLRQIGNDGGVANEETMLAPDIRRLDPRAEFGLNACRLENESAQLHAAR